MLARRAKLRPAAEAARETTDTLREGLCQGFSISTAPRARVTPGCACAPHRRDRLPLSFFRRRKSEDQAPLTRAPERPEVEPLTVAQPAAPASTDGQSSVTDPK